MNKNNDLGLLVIRVATGLLMLFHGIAKLVHGLDFIRGMLANIGLPGFVAYGAIVGEVLAPIALIIGFRSRIAASIYTINCIVAILMVHSHSFFSLNEFGGWSVELLGLYIAGAIAIFFTGGGKYAVATQNKWD